MLPGRPPCAGGFGILLVDVDTQLQKSTSILSHWNVETMDGQAGELSEGYRAVESARDSTQHSQRRRMDTVASQPNTLSALHPLSLNYQASSTPTKKRYFSSCASLLLNQLHRSHRLRSRLFWLDFHSSADTGDGNVQI